MALVDSRPTPISQLRGVTAAEVTKLKGQKISNNTQLLEKTKTTADRSKLAKAAGISETRLKEAVNRADLVRLDGLGPAGADLFENAGVNSVKELATRNPENLHATLVKYAASRPDLGYQVPSEATVKSLVSKAAEVVAPAGPLTPGQSPQQQATAAMHTYVDDVLFGADPAGAEFRKAVLDGRSAADIAQLKTRMHADVNGFFASPDTEELDGPTTTTWAGRLLDLYTEVSVKKNGTGVERVYVEID